MLEEYKLNKATKVRLPQDQSTYVNLAQELTNAEAFLRAGDVEGCLKEYQEVINTYISMRDFETVSYFYN